MRGARVRGLVVGGGLAATIALAWSRPAAADETDGAYGRLSGDLLFVGAVGIAADAGGPLFETHASLSYLSTAGIYARYTEGFGASDARYGRSVATGFELRPLFLGRWALDLEKGPAHLDLFADSFTMIAGAYWAAPGDAGIDDEPGLELGVALEVPILPSASGPYFGVAALARWPGDVLTGQADANILDRGSLLVFTLAWHQILDAGLVDLRDATEDRP